MVVHARCASAPRMRAFVVLLLVASAWGFSPRTSTATRVTAGASARITPLASTQVRILEQSTRYDGTLDPHRLAADAEYERAPMVAQRISGATYFATLGACIASPALPVFARLVLIQYVAFSAFEYGFHRWCMHASRGTIADRIFARWNRLHVQVTRVHRIACRWRCHVLHAARVCVRSTMSTQTTT